MSARCSRSRTRKPKQTKAPASSSFVTVKQNDMSFTLLHLLLLLSLSYGRVNSDPRATEAALICNTNNTAPRPLRGSFITNFLAAMDAVTPQISRQRFASVRIGGNATVYAFGECLRDLSAADCDLCFANLKTQILRCLPFQLATRSGRLFFDGCYLRYDDHDFFSESIGSRDKVICSGESSSSSSYAAAAETLVRRLVAEAPARDGFFTGSVRPPGKNVTVYGLAQCWRFVRGSGCENCLAGSVQKVRSCSGKREARILNAGCYLRYSDKKFYDNSTSIASGQGNHGSRTLAIVSSVASAGFALIIAGAAIGFFLRRRVLRKRREEKQLGSLLNTVNKSKLSFSYEVLEKATDYFNSSNKLGQGGSGSVYKGVLPDGKTVAIKRLFFNTRQWVDHFFNEVNLISGIRHKNLVELLGCSITGPESLLVYEYVPNQSVYDNLFGAKKNVPILRWETRHKIVLGTAEGLAHLHEESNLRIIHRDVKLSNVLLDQNMEPKVADFGLARLFPEDKTHISTAIAGTLGYMAPEYIVRGKLSEKADVYSFGVLVIELVSGRKNNTVSQNSRSILETVWNLHGMGNLSDAIDPSLEGNFEAEEASRLLQIGLVCVQASAELRPSMSSIVKMIKDNHEIPKPTQPPFLHTNSVEIGRSRENKSHQTSSTQSSRNTITESWIEPR